MAEFLHALENLSDAVDALAAGSGRVRDRLLEASTYLIRVRPEDIPDDDLRRTFIAVMEDDLSYAQPQGDEGRILATLRIINDEEACSVARRILDLHRQLDRLLRTHTEDCQSSSDVPGKGRLAGRGGVLRGRT
jgi:hypothetical protein